MTPLASLADVLARLAGLPSGTAAEAARADQNARWAAGERVLAERYLAALPRVAAAPDDALVLVYGEFLLRTELGQAVDPDVFLARFSQYRDTLAAVFDVHRGLALAAESSSVSRTGATPVVPGYDRLELAGRGGMGVVYKAREIATGRTVAVKVVRAGVGSDALVRFLQEADVLARLEHPNVVRFLGRGATDVGPYLVTEWVAGGSLAARLIGVPVPADEAAQLLRGVARGLGAAHAVGVIHRDVKPGNILLEGDATRGPGGSAPPAPKVTDFGLARLTGCGGTLTATGELIGTRRYMPPEQFDGRAREVGPWSDLFSLGAVLYELLTGRPAFPDRDTPAGLATFVAPRSVRELVPEVPARLEAVCGKALRPTPTDRFRSADEFAAALGPA